MARRVRQSLDADWREKIKISMLINRLMKHANGEVEMSATQIKAAEILLRKRLPDLKQSEMTVRDEREPTRDELIRRAEQVGMSAADLFGDEPKH